MPRIAIVGMACRYPDAASPRELWENAIAGRRAFRRLPDQRLPLADYWDPDPSAPDRFYALNAAVIEGYEFDRIGYRISGGTYRSTDLTHWLALDMAAAALADAGFPGAKGIPGERTSVIVGNTLTGEFSRANTLRLRWPYVRRTVAEALLSEDWNQVRVEEFLNRLEADYKRPFPPVDEDTLAGGLSNTIAGRICNYFDFKGGGYTVDGACSSSLLSVASSCSALVNGDVDVAVAGGVDLSIDPFEMIGFAKTSALAAREMRVYDRQSNGFWPGEGCGMLVLMREADVDPARHHVYATIAGWGISSDGHGGITRPHIDGHQLALRRAYERAGFGIDTVPMFEGHGTGTQVGDATELRALSAARLMADRQVAPAAISSIKAGIGHTKAAAGVAGLIKAAMAVQEEVLPPTVGCTDPHPVFQSEARALRVLSQAESWPAGQELRAGVTAMGFGGINTHIVLDKTTPARAPLTSRTRVIVRSMQDAELLVLDGRSPEQLRDRLGRLSEVLPSLSYAELSDLAVAGSDELRDLPYRAAVVASTPAEAAQRIGHVLQTLNAGQTNLFDTDGGAFLSHVRKPGRIGYLFPGQGSGRGTGDTALRRRFAEVAEVHTRFAVSSDGGDPTGTAAAQPRIVLGSAAGLAALSALGIQAEVAVGHSLGEISALHWAGTMDERLLQQLAATRGQLMTDLCAAGSMAGVSAAADIVADLSSGLSVVIAGYNGPAQTVVSGGPEAIDAFGRRAEEAGITWVKLPVAHAFHSPSMAPAVGAFRGWLHNHEFSGVERRVISTVTGEVVGTGADIADLLSRQLTAPVRFAQAVELAAKDVDLFIEVGPGRVLSGLTRSVTEVPVVALDTDSQQLRGLLHAAAAAYVAGGPVTFGRLFADRLTRPLRLGSAAQFFASPCEALATRPRPELPSVTVVVPEHPESSDASVSDSLTHRTSEGTVELLRRLVAERAELPIEMVTDDSLLLDHLHLSSITVGSIFAKVAHELNLPVNQAPTNLATATLAELAEALDAAADQGAASDRRSDPAVAGAAAWVRAFRVDLDQEAVPALAPPTSAGAWAAYASHGHPLAEPLRTELERSNVGAGVLVCLPPGCSVEDLGTALEGAKAAVDAPADSRFLLVQTGRGAAAMVKTLRQEAPQLRVSIVHLPPPPWDVSSTVARVIAEVRATNRFSEVHHEVGGDRRVPVMRAIASAPAGSTQPLDDSDVLLVTGGGKGITAECALALAGDYGARLAVLGRSDPEQDPELAANLQRMAAAGVTVQYVRADVVDADQVRAAVAQVTEGLGSVTAVLHGAGHNRPTRLKNLDEEAVRDTLAPKVDGLRALLEAVDPARLKLLVTFGSIIGRAGLRGEAHYATANEWLADLTENLAQQHPDCRTLCLEWSVWSGVGMGDRLAVAESLAREGITPITPDQGVQILRRLVTDPQAPSVVVVTGRTGTIDTVRREEPPLPLLRFVDTTLVRYHGVEFVTETELNAGTDPYLRDHLLDGDLLFPAVLGLEAMAQVAAVTIDRLQAPLIEKTEFLRPIVVPPDGDARIRIAATVTDQDTVDVTIRCAETDFGVDHFRARMSFVEIDVPSGPPDQVGDTLAPVALDVSSELYGGLLFQGPRFQRLRTYHRLAARHVDAQVAVQSTAGWFAAFLPARLLLADPGMRDALLHGNQVCVPDATLLPMSVERIHPLSATSTVTGTLRYCATERYRDGDSYVYDIAVRDDSGMVRERWEGLTLRAVRRNRGRGPWSAPLLGPYLERWTEQLLGVQVEVVVEPDGRTRPAGLGAMAWRRSLTAVAVERACAHPVSVRYRPDGRPEILGGRWISAAHAARLTLCVLADRQVTCDVEPVAERSSHAWQGLLGNQLAAANRLVTDSGESLDLAGTRIWTVLECLRKAGLPTDAPLSQVTAERGPWQVFASGTLRVLTMVASLRDVQGPVIFAIAAEGKA